MKKILITIMIVMLAALLSVGASAETYLKGDVDMNGKITASDARKVLRVGAKIEEISDTQMLIADMDNNGKITAADARTVLRISAKLEEGKGEIIVGETPSDPEPVERTELLSGVGISIDDFMKKFGGMKELDTNDGTISYTNDYVTVVSDPTMIASGNINSISITGGNYMLCGVYAGMSENDALSTLKASKWIVKDETSSQIILAKNGMNIKIAVSDNVVTFVEYYLGISVVNPGDQTTTTQPPETTTKPEETTTQPPETTTNPTETTTKPDETTTDKVINNKDFLNLPEQAQAYLLGNFSLKGYTYNGPAKDPVSMSVTKDNMKAGMFMPMEDGSLLSVDVLIRDPSGESKMYLVCNDTKLYHEVDSITMLIMQIKPEDLKINMNKVDPDKVSISNTLLKEGNTIYTVYTIKSDVETCDIYMIGDNIKRIDNKDNAGILVNRIDVDVFYPEVSASDFSLDGYTSAGLFEVFGFSGDIGDLLG